MGMIKGFLRKVPLIKKMSYLKYIENGIHNIELQMSILSNQMIDLRLHSKAIENKKINVIFICFRPAIWDSERTIYEAMKAEEAFAVKIVAIPKLNLHHTGMIDDEGAYEYYKSEGAINGYDWEKNTFIDLMKLKPDYVFYQQPYNAILPPAYRSDVVSKYAKICYICYFSYWSNYQNQEMISHFYAYDFFKNVSYYFAQHQEEYDYITQNIKERCPLLDYQITGYPKYDDIQIYKNRESKSWNSCSHKGHFRVIWTPRWSTNENNCFFFAYKDHFLDLCRQNGEIDFLFRAHPQMWLELEGTGEFSKSDREQFAEEINKLKNFSIDKKTEYLDTFYSSDCLISDTSSMMIQYFLTGKPVIYCYNPQSTYSFFKGGNLSKGFYWAKNWEELQEILVMLKEGKDPLNEERKKIISEYFYIPNIPAGKRIKEIIKTDALK